MANRPTDRQKPLERAGPEPLYRQLAAQLKQSIREGQLKPGDRIDSEDLLSRRFAISRITVRQAIEELVRQHILVRRQGKGTFVTTPAVRHDLRRLHGLANSLFAQAPDASMSLLRYELRAAPAGIAEAMGLAAGAAALTLERLYLIGPRPVAYAEDWLVPEVAAIPRAQAGLTSTEDMMRRVGIAVARCEVAIRAELAGARIGRLLRRPARTPLLVLRRSAFGADDRVKETGRICFCSDSYEFVSAQDLRTADSLFDLRTIAQHA